MLYNNIYLEGCECEKQIYEVLSLSFNVYKKIREKLYKRTKHSFIKLGKLVKQVAQLVAVKDTYKVKIKNKMRKGINNPC